MSVSETRQAERQTEEQGEERAHRAGAFDIRMFIALLIGLYGVVLLLTGFVGTTENDLARAGGLNINLLAGVGMIAFAAGFVAWARMRPVEVPERAHKGEAAEGRQPARVRRTGQAGASEA
jgi:hypothetical protein